MGVDISVIVCTRNRGIGLIPCLRRLEQMETPSGLTWELILVDNNSTDDTASVIRAFAENACLDMRYVCEKAPGGSHARNTGIAAARGGIVAFTDHDCMVDKYWLRTIMKEFEHDPGLSGLGGRVELFDIRDKAVTVTTCKDRVILSLSDDLAGFIHGCNMSFRREVFERIGTFDTRLGTGTRLMSAEDSDFLYRVMKAQMKVVYSPDVLVYHHHGRRTDLQVENLMNGYALGRGAFYCKHIMKRDAFILKSAYWEGRSLVKTLAGKRQPYSLKKMRALHLLRYLLMGFWLFLWEPPASE